MKQSVRETTEIIETYYTYVIRKKNKIEQRKQTNERTNERTNK